METQKREERTDSADILSEEIMTENLLNFRIPGDTNPKSVNELQIA